MTFKIIFAMLILIFTSDSFQYPCKILTAIFFLLFIAVIERKSSEYIPPVKAAVYQTAYKKFRSVKLSHTVRLDVLYFRNRLVCYTLFLKFGKPHIQIKKHEKFYPLFF